MSIGEIMWSELQQVNWDMISAVVGFAALLFAVPGFLLGMRRIKNQLGRLELQNEEGVNALKKLANIRRLNDGDQNALWSRPLDFSDLDYHECMQKSIPIVLVTNFKGGVGKTTIAGTGDEDTSICAYSSMANKKPRSRFGLRGLFLSVSGLCLSGDAALLSGT